MRGWLDRFRRTLRTVRGRSTLLSMIIVAVALTLAFALVVFLYRDELQGSLDVTLEQQVADRARLLDEGSSPDALTTVLAEESLIWIGSEDGTPLADGGQYVPVENPVPPLVGGVTTTEVLIEERHDDGEAERERMELRLASTRAADGTVVLAGAETEVIGRRIGPLATLFTFAVPVLTVLVGLVTWFVGGRVLRPVERMRSRADEITGVNLHERVPVPDTDDEIHDLALTLNSMLDRLESHDQALREFTADASHELKSPVANLRALIDTKSIDDPEWALLQDRLRGESDRLRDLVDNLLFLASHQAGAPAATAESVDLDDLLFDEAELVAATGRVGLDLGGVEPVAVVGSRADLARLVRNLVDNAARHAQAKVALATSTADGDVVLSVSDDGPGVSPADRRRIFERFTRLDEARARDDGGSGLGLAIVEQIATDHRAEVIVDDAALGGARFTVRFPAP